MMGVDFAVIGFQKCGTCSLRSWLRSFSNVQLPSWEWGIGAVHDAHDKEPEHYPIPTREPNKLLGTVNPQLALGDLSLTLPRLNSFHPFTKLLAITRDPVERAFSAWRMFASVREYGETRTFEEAIDNCLAAPDALGPIHDYVRAGEYRRIIEMYLRFGRPVLVVDLKRMIREPKERLRVARYLGLDEAHATSTEFPHEHVGQRSEATIPEDAARKLRGYFQLERAFAILPP